jgi:shikimate 5-dehydrogenase
VLDECQFDLLTIGFGGKTKGILAKLIDEKLIEKTDTGWTLPPGKWEEWQETKEEIEAKRQADRDRKAKWREERRGSHSGTPAGQDEGLPAESVLQTTDPYPDNKYKKKFTPPTEEAVQAYCLERANGIDAAAFVAHYAANGWRRGKTQIKDWKACVVTWERSKAANGSAPKKSRIYNPATDPPYNPHAED